MSLLLLEMQVLLIALVGIGGFLFGLLGILGRKQPTKRRPLVNALAALALLAAAGGAFALGLSVYTWAALAGLGALAVLFWAVGSAGLGSVVLLFGRLGRDPRIQGTLVLLCAPAVALWWVHLLDQQAAAESPAFSEIAQFLIAPSLQEATEVKAYTDRGRPVPLFHVAESESPLPDLLSGENRVLHDLDRRLIRTAPPDNLSNCHGWVFAMGQFWIHSTEVDGILDDNGYRAVQVPEPGDIAVYRSEMGAPLHSALVRAAADDGMILLEGKWGILGRYVHAPADQIYSQHWTYYHTDRRGLHRLHGLGGETPVTPSEAAVQTD
jgi:hypothetical protein